MSSLRGKVRHHLRVPLDEPATAQVLVPDAKPEKEPKRRRRSKVKEALGLGDAPEADPIVVLPEADGDRAPRRGSVHEAAKVAKPRTVTTSQGPYQLPPLDLLAPPRRRPPTAPDETEVMQALGHTLLTFGVDAKVVAAHRGPTVTMYEVEVASGTKVNKVLNLSSDIAYALATPDVRIMPRSRSVGDRDRGAEQATGTS